jgi:hypothetical protein
MVEPGPVPLTNLQLAVCGVSAMGLGVVKMRLYCPDFWVDLRVTEFDGAWLASADTPDGPTLGRGRSALSAAINALEPFDGYVEDLIRSAPRELFQK